MSTVSSARIVVSCLPVIGSAIGFHDAIEDPVAFKKCKQNLRRACDTFLEVDPLALVGNPQANALEATVQASTAIIQRAEELNGLLKNVIVHAKCSIASNLLTLIGVVTLVAMGVFSIVVGYYLSVFFAGQVLTYSCNLYIFNKELNELESMTQGMIVRTRDLVIAQQLLAFVQAP